MNKCIQRCKKWLKKIISAIFGLWCIVKHFLREQFNKNIYTRVIFTNVTTFAVGLIILTILSSFAVKQVTYAQVQQEMLRKAKRVNFALLQQKDRPWILNSDEANDQVQARQDLMKFLADSFDSKITVFDMEGNIADTSEEQELVPGSKVDKKFVEMLKKGGNTTRIVDGETDQLTFIAVVPMGNNNDAIEKGIMLESKPSNYDLTSNTIRSYLIIGGMILLVIIIFISMHLAMQISKPISQLATTVAEVSRGSFSLSTDDKDLDEINVLTYQLNKLAERLQQLQAESQRIEQEKTRLFSEISHEIRTPLTSVQGFVEAIRDGMVQDEAVMEKYLDTIYTQTLHISRLVDDLLAISRLESGNITVEKLPVNLSALTQSVVAAMEGLASNKNTSILLEKAENALVLGDVDRMEQIIKNLIKNAIEATENGTIKVSVEVRQDKVFLTVEDSGVGISPDDLPHIWERFYRAKNHRRSYTQEEGSGLGLVIVKKLVELQDGKIDITSKLGKGTTFTVSFPSYNQE